MSVRRRVELLDMNAIGKFLVLAGLLLVAVGAFLWSGIGKGWLGQLPGDIHYTRGNFSFYFPIVTCLLISAMLTLLFWLFRK
jgi:membrane protein implicated in regulation of membrane protease activity